MLDRDSSLRLDLLRFPAVVGVVFIHNYGTTVGVAGGHVGVIDPGVFGFIQTLISSVIARIAVPLFFVTSGYLFFRNLPVRKKSYVEKLRTRLRTLLIPFVFWNLVTLSIIALAQAIPVTRTYLSGKTAEIATFETWDYLDAIFGIHQLPIAYQFWFVRDLMLLMLFAPVITFMYRAGAEIFLGVIFACWFINSWPIYAPACEAVLFFIVGAYVALSGKNLFATDKYGPAALVAYWPIAILDAHLVQQPVDAYLHRVGIVLGVTAALYVTKLILRTARLSTFVLWLASSSFFTYAVHEPLLTVLKKITYTTFSPQSLASVVALYFLIPVVVIALAVIAHRALSKHAPGLTRWVTGGR
jgi:surface polysaccharide O-acyltransferase-like enzyme